MARINLNRSAIKELADSDAVVDALGQVAQKVTARIQAPSRMSKYTRAGKSDKGAFAQSVVRGPGAVAWEYGSRYNPPAGQIRGAVSRKVT